jgi:serine protease AprX
MTSVVCAGDGFCSKGLYKGIASDAELVLLKVQDANGRITTENIVKALAWVIAHHKEYGIRIVNMSLGGDEVVSYKQSEIDKLAEHLVAEGVVIVAAAGNDEHGVIKPPANSPAVITVGGADDENTLQALPAKLYHSAYGITMDELAKPELLAHAIWIAAPILPGTKEQKESEALHYLLGLPDEELMAGLVKQYVLTGLDNVVLENQDPAFLRQSIISRLQACKFISTHYMHVDGTSFAAPIVSSVIAQLFEINPQLTPAMIREILFSTAKRIEHLPAERQGFGLVRPRNATLKVLKREIIISPGESPKINDNKTIEFYVQHDCATQVSLAGTFNNWAQDTLLLEPGKNGVWKIEIPLLPAGRYHYKFFINEKVWLEDVNNPYREPDGFNGFNSILTINS